MLSAQEDYDMYDSFASNQHRIQKRTSRVPFGKQNQIREEEEEEEDDKETHDDVLSMSMHVVMHEYDRKECVLSAPCKLELKGGLLSITMTEGKYQLGTRVFTVDLPSCRCTTLNQATHSFDLYSPNLKMRFNFSLTSNHNETSENDVLKRERFFLHQQLAPLRERLEEFYARVNPQKLPVKQQVIDAYTSKEADLNRDLAHQYGCDLTSLPPMLRLASVPERVTNFFLIYNPSKRSRVHKLVGKFAGQEDALNAELRQKYDADLTLLDPSSPSTDIRLLDLVVWIKHLQIACRPKRQTGRSCQSCNGQFSQATKTKRGISAFFGFSNSVGKPVHCLCCGGIFCAECTAARCSLPFLYHTKPVQCCAQCSGHQQLVAQLRAETFECVLFDESAGVPTSPRSIQFHQWFELGRVLGKGSFSEVRVTSLKNRSPASYSEISSGEGLDWDQQSVEFATKCIVKAGMQEKHTMALLNELRALRRLDAHPSICRLYGFFDEDAACYLLMEKVGGGTLLDWATRGAGRHRTCHSESQLRELVRQSCEALAYCHRQGVVHRDVKMDNILVCEHSRENANIAGANYGRSSPDCASPTIKLADFGLCQYLTPGQQVTKRSGTLLFMAPEVLNDSPSDYKVDVWAVGVLMHLFLSGRYPFEIVDDNMPMADFVSNVNRGLDPAHWSTTAWAHVSAEARDLVRHLLSANPRNRPTMAQVLEHPWMKAKMAPGSSFGLPCPPHVLASLRRVATNLHPTSVKAPEHSPCGVADLLLGAPELPPLALGRSASPMCTGKPQARSANEERGLAVCRKEGIGLASNSSHRIYA
jgi:serine/threonine protein kinase